jgi:hypothetical protein
MCTVTFIDRPSGAYSAGKRAAPNAVSRGVVIPAALHCRRSDEAEAVIEALPLDRINPFRLIGVFPAEARIMEWRWDLQKLDGINYPWRANIRGRTFARALRQRSAGRAAWLRRLHRSHLPGCGPYSTCMHRAEAATVSYTEVSIVRRTATMRYVAGPLCCTRANSIRGFALR